MLRNLAIVVDDPVPEAAFFAFAHAAAEVGGFRVRSVRTRATENLFWAILGNRTEIFCDLREGWPAATKSGLITKLK